MNKDVRDWIEKISNETVKCKCGSVCDVTLIIRKHYPGVEVRAYCMGCDRTISIREPVYLIKEANIDLVEEMIEVLRRRMGNRNESTD